MPEVKRIEKKTQPVSVRESDGVSRSRTEHYIEMEVSKYGGFFSPDQIYKIEVPLPVDKVNFHVKDELKNLPDSIYSPIVGKKMSIKVDENLSSVKFETWGPNVGGTNLRKWNLKPSRVERIR